MALDADAVVVDVVAAAVVAAVAVDDNNHDADVANDVSDAASSASAWGSKVGCPFTRECHDGSTAAAADTPLSCAATLTTIRVTATAVTICNGIKDSTRKSTKSKHSSDAYAKYNNRYCLDAYASAAVARVATLVAVHACCGGGFIMLH